MNAVLCLKCMVSRDDSHILQATWYVDNDLGAIFCWNLFNAAAFTFFLNY